MTGHSFSIRDGASLVAAELRNAGDLHFTFLENGSIFSITHRGILINQILGSPIDGGLGNLWLRRHRDAGISHFPLLGPHAGSRFHVAADAVSWTGSCQGVAYRCTLQPAGEETLWFWTVSLHNTAAEPRVVDAVLSQDLGLAAPAAVRSNELYTSQYIDHTVYQAGSHGYVICSRQNQEQEHGFPWILHGCLQGAAGYLTDGFQFFGLDYKATNVPAALTADDFPNTNYQYELALPTLTSAPVRLPPGGAAEVTFFALYDADHPQATSEQDLERVATAERAFLDLQARSGGSAAFTPLPETSSLFDTAPLFPALDLTPEDLDRYFGPERRHVERHNGTVLSFFHGSELHVVAKAKELLTERPHGHIMRSGRHLSPHDDTLSLTAWMYGVFTSHLAIGNTNFNKLLTVSRNSLNVLKSSGQRIFVRSPDGYRLLGLPSAFEMGLNGARWIYKGEDVTIVVKVWTSMRDPACFLEIEVDGPDDLELLISHNVVLGDSEFETGAGVYVDEEAKRVELIPAPGELMARRYPEARFFIVSRDAEEIERVGGDGLLFSDGSPRNTPYVVIKTRPLKHFTLALTGNVLDGGRAMELADRYADDIDGYELVQRQSKDFWRGVRKNASLQVENRAGDVAKLDDIIRWYAHNALVHFTTPYGLEQYSGAAWGTRDVCQGPVEFLLATRNYHVIKTLLTMVYSHQDPETGDWPQWFMFDRFHDIHAPDSHADIVIWPLKALCDYVEATDDLRILDAEIPDSAGQPGSVTQQTASLFAHTEKQIERMKKGCVADTALPGYGHGDWEDTLQPADPAVRQHWVSPWTVELMYQTLTRYAAVCERSGRPETAERLTAFCERTRQDFNRFLMKDGVVAGLAELGSDGVDYLLHPCDRRTGVHYRLLPMTRGMLSGMFTPEQMRDHLAVIHDHLLFPDGARLMDRPMAYHGGTERLFKRAETAANFGREIGLQYVHAHIRYVEAMARIGRPEEAYRGLLEIVPIAIQEAVPSALPRQSNAYFSSSDAAFCDRYQALQRFDAIKTLEVGVKGGWRVYSSGPGMFIATLILNVLGLRDYYSDVLLDPVLPKRLNGVALDFEYADRPVRYVYSVTGDGYSPRRVTINGADVSDGRYAENPYRRGGMLIPRSDFLRALDREDNVVEISV